MDEPPEPYDWERDPDYEWLDRFGKLVGGALLVGAFIMVLMVIIGCSLTETPPTTTTTTTTTVLKPDHITVPRPVTTTTLRP